MFIIRFFQLQIVFSFRAHTHTYKHLCTKDGAKLRLFFGIKKYYCKNMPNNFILLNQHTIFLKSVNFHLCKV
jgi:hypothetical protein